MDQRVWSLQRVGRAGVSISFESDPFVRASLLLLSTIPQLLYSRIGSPGPLSWKEEFIKIDVETQTKVIRQIKGEFLDPGFSLHEVIFKIIAKDSNSCIIRSSVTFEVVEEFESNASLIPVASFWGRDGQSSI